MKIDTVQVIVNRANEALLFPRISVALEIIWYRVYHAKLIKRS